ncbi:MULTISPECIES: hypothetical protein [Chryseobacterium]|uniref:Uncharacterized protein n=1 Tax=Chryseobacterium muglaense TaxID=2893752 RepID=A0ABR8M8W1_9FLAO|nr:MULTISPECIES: hypothetical protein [Chryseobacterium]MBD3906744.1 hypothetical protein [Chryseobacterium muglaense]
MSDIKFLKTYHILGEEYFIERDAMNNLHFFLKKTDLESDPLSNPILNELENSLNNLSDSFIDKTVADGLCLNNKYFLVYHHVIPDLKLSVFTIKERGKLTGISLLFINNKRSLIFNTADQNLLLQNISDYYFQNPISIRPDPETMQKNIARMLKDFSL